MENEEKKCFVNIGNYTGENPIEIIYREDKAVEHLKPMPVKMPEAINISGTIHTVAEWLGKRKELIEINNCRLVVNRDESAIRLIVNECNSMPSLSEEAFKNLDGSDLNIALAPKSIIEGRMEYSEMYTDLQINEDYWWSPVQLSKFLRLNRVIFGDRKEEGMALISALKNVKAKISSDYEKKKELHGQISKTEYFSQEVMHNLPESFTVELAIFKGSPKEKYEIEIDADIVDGEIKVQLLSPAINEDVENARDVLINKEVEAISQLCPDLVIIEV